MEPIAYLALEIKQRELESRVVIAARLLKAGIAVVFGQQWGLFNNVDRLPPGVVLFKTVNGIQANMMEACRRQGHLVAATDEESLLCTEHKCFLEVFSPMAAENCDLFFAQSELHRDIVERRFPSLRGRTQVAGNARADFLSADRRAFFDLEVRDIIKAHGPYILFNTNYAQINTIWKDMKHLAVIAEKAGLLNVDDPDSVTEYKLKLEWEQRNREEMIMLLQWAIDELPEKNIILRPHPGETPEFWTERFRDCKRVHIVPRSNPHPWILGADMVVHTTCTTGLEAAFMGKPVANLMPLRHPAFDFITTQANPTFKSWQDAAAAIEGYFKVGEGPIAENSQDRAVTLASHFAMDGREATEKIASGMVSLLRDHGVGTSTGEFPRLRGEGFRRGSRGAFMKDKFAIEAEELSRSLQGALKGLGASLTVKMIPLEESLFVLLPQK
jgi:surface carbohydrate biosynthesis protein